MTMASWEYCQLRQEGEDDWQVTYFSPDLVQDVEDGDEQAEFASLQAALHYLGEEGWEAFQIDPDGNWFLKRPDDWDEDWDDDDDDDDDYDDDDE
jgi:hypothetical protein